ncbi:hypothetical protein SASPL_150932 [Salvia splendens]|uniref:Mitogen-activated protein kinase kinase kinase 1 n=1 Tax=Salvia splendens TaxID=180675 RepID=A0A8X8W7S7_SALSN|nr:mitogen-activated protein kinase kinase kinase 1 [Salvia splendens]KAG6389464.1 hypothetical protein SASPL_150932 [Salvia splendens]
MESVASSSTPHPHHHHRPRLTAAQSFSDRIIRAVRHRLRLLHRSGSLFFVLGATGNVYTVNLSAAVSCSCPDRATPCKHIIFVFIRALALPLDDPCLSRRTLRPCQLRRLLSLPTAADSLATATLRDRFHQISAQARAGGGRIPRPPTVVPEEGAACPVCLEEMGREERVVSCGACKNVIHEECFLAWKRSCRRRSATCVLCRARWRSGGDDPDKYLNLSAYVNEEDMVEDGGCT